jgi:hypothetical protein
MPKAMVETLKSYTDKHIQRADSRSVVNVTEPNNIAAAMGDVNTVSAGLQHSLQILLFE